MLSPEVQVAFNLKKGSLPVRGDVDLAAANDCMKKGLEILAAGNIVPDTSSCSTRGHGNKQLNDLIVEFFKTVDTPEARRSASPTSSPRRLSLPS
jgi:glucose/mannose transport system substrate-binding protein